MLQPPHADYLIVTCNVPDSVTVNGFTLALPGTYLHGHLNPFTDSPTFTIQAIPENLTEPLKVGDTVVAHFLDKIPMSIPNKDLYLLPVEKVLLVIE